MAATHVRPDEVELVDGTIVTIRPMRASDAPNLVEFHGTLSDETTYLRFFSVHPHLSASEVLRFTHVDHRRREAFVALVDDRIIGVARFDRLEDDSAEVAFVVSDVWQGHGLAHVLLERLVARAREVGITRLVAETLPQNRPMIAVFGNSGLPVASIYQDGVVHVTIEL